MKTKSRSALSILLLGLTCVGVFAGSSVHWGYSGHEGPEHWGTLSPSYQVCKDGQKQSPIDIHGVAKKALDPIQFDYTAKPKSIVNNGHTIQVNMNPGSSITVNGKTYKLLQFHFHSPSEHTINGAPGDMVAHFVHQAADGQLGVVGVLMNSGASNPVVAELWQKLPKTSGSKTDLGGFQSDVASVMPVDRAYYNYSGSLTTPPCSEGVNWMVLQQPSSVSATQVAAFTALFSKSVRPVQPLNGRQISASN